MYNFIIIIPSNIFYPLYSTNQPTSGCFGYENTLFPTHHHHRRHLHQTLPHTAHHPWWSLRQASFKTHYQNANVKLPVIIKGLYILNTPTKELWRDYEQHQKIIRDPEKHQKKD